MSPLPSVPALIHAFQRACLDSRIGRAALAVLIVCLCAATPGGVRAADAPRETLHVADPYLELRTGPGRGFPVFYVAARAETIEVELRHTDWFKVRIAAGPAAGREGWVNRSQLERTLTEAGGTKTFRDVALDDYLRRKVELGAAWGAFKSEPMLKAWTGIKLSDTISVEGTLGQVQGVFSGTNFWHLNLAVEPWSDQRLSPFVSIGVGQFSNIPNASLVGGVDTHAKLANAMVGVKYHISERFVARVDYTLYTAFLSDTRNGEYRAFTAGISFFF